MPNPTGVNGYDNGTSELVVYTACLALTFSMFTVPPEDKLVAALQQYAREQLSLERRIQRLGADLGYHIKSVISSYYSSRSS